MEEKKLGQIDLRMHQVRSLKELRLSRKILNTEGLMLILDKKHRTPSGGRMLFKYLDAQEEVEVMERKTKILTALNNSKYASLPELIIPTHAVSVDTSPAGFALPLVERHINLGKFINTPQNIFDKKLYLLKKLGDLISKVQRVEDKNRMFFGDLNEYNFIIDREGKIRAIDLDSAFMTLDGVTPSEMAYYLLKNLYLEKLPDKYKTTEEGIIIPSDNTDLYCYIMIIINTLAGEAMMHRIDIATYFDYLMYLEEIGVPKELIDIFRNIYIPKDNINPSLYLELLPKGIEKKTSFSAFKKVYKRK